MLKGLKFFIYQLRAKSIQSGQMIDSNSVHFPLYPLSDNAQRMMRFSGSSRSTGITPYEVSDFLYQLSQEDLQSLKEKSLEIEPKIKKIDNEILPLRLYSFVIDTEYRHGNKSKKELKEKEAFIKLSVEHLKKMLKITQLNSLPVGVASNFIFAAAKLGIYINQDLEETLVPLIEAKVKHLHAKGIIETIWGLATIKYQGTNTLNKLAQELKVRQFVERVHVINAPFDHLQYINDPDDMRSNSGELIRKAAELVTDSAVKSELGKIASGYR